MRKGNLNVKDKGKQSLGTLSHFPVPFVKLMRDTPRSFQEVGIFSLSHTPSLYFVQNKQLNFPKIIDRETFKALRHCHQPDPASSTHDNTGLYLLFL